MPGDISAAVNHPMRVLLIYSAIIGVPLNLVRFIIMLRPVAIFSILILIASAVLAIIIRRLHRQGAHHKSAFATPITAPWNCLIADVSLAFLLLITLISTWTKSHWQDTGMTFLTAYSSTPLLFNMFLHLYLALLVLLGTHKIQDFIRELIGDLVADRSHTCSHCQGRSRYQTVRDEEQPLVSGTIDDQEETHESGQKVGGQSTVWN